MENNRLVEVPEFLGEIRTLKSVHLRNNFIVDLPTSLSESHRIALPGWVPFQSVRYTPSLALPHNLCLKYQCTTRQLPAFRETSFVIAYAFQNTGAATLFDVKFEEKFIHKDFCPPAASDINAIRSARESRLISAISKDAFTIDGDSKDELRGTLGELNSGETLRVEYQVLAAKPSAEDVYEPQVTLLTRTSKNESPLVLILDLPKIPVVHVRRKFSKGKEINALKGEGNYEITLFVENTKNNVLGGVNHRDHRG
ncbi:MAG: hypothetical protein RBG13Loki_1744 [Promethearchaeota archaeon CR_4]|nr:MAG: hypothetical protein RBG13Loki_1744 [Candidatus Lokiarchaeota archaeon CR_4]